MAHNRGATTSTGGSIQGIVLYPVNPYLVIAIVLLVVGSFQWVAFLYAKFDSRRRPVRDGESRWSSKRTTSAFSFPLVALNFYRVLAFRTTVGFRSYVFNLAELFAAVGYVALLLVWTFVIQSHPDGEPLNWCSRAALLAASQLLFVTVLGTKNNVISLVTRISADKLNIIHRVAARACLILIGLHVLGGGRNFPFYQSGSGDFILFGKVAAVTFAALALVSLRPIRERVYELFFYLHFVAVIVILVCVTLHVNMYGATNFVYYVWPSLVVWAADRLIRTIRLVYFNLALFSSGWKRGTLDATTELLSDRLVRMRFRRPDRFCWSPGQFAYLIVPSVSRLPLDAHPFSIASVDSALFAPDVTAAENSQGKELVFLIGVKNGFTRRLKDVAARGERVKVYVDGPYGQGVNLGCYDTSLLVAGGTGITFALPALLSVVESARNGSCCRRVVLVWAIRDADMLNWVSESLHKAARFAPPELKVDVQVFLTKDPAAASRTNLDANPFEDQDPFANPPSPSPDSKETASLHPWIRVNKGRPNLERMLDEETRATSGRVFVGVCGPSAMTEVVRRTLRFGWSSPSSPRNGGPSVTLHVESFGYA